MVKHALEKEGMATHLWGITVNAERFWAKVEKTPLCWIWLGARTSKGYGNIGWGPRGAVHNTSAHRFSYQLNVGVVPDNLYVLHRCDNRACVRPDHLFLGTARDNILDCFHKGRMNWKPGLSVIISRRRSTRNDAV